jgi:U3 small nucleolar RNA-associated protein 21
VAISPCGTFALVGSAAGSIGMFNLQSGIHQRNFPNHISSIQKHRSKPHQGTKMVGVDQYIEDVNIDKKHTQDVTGLMVDSLNQKVVSCGLDGKVKVCRQNHGMMRSRS